MSIAHELVVRAATEGSSATISPIQPSPRPCSSRNLPGADWTEGQTIDGEFLRELLASATLDAMPRGLRIIGARITGALNLDHLSVRVPVRLQNCFFTDAVSAVAATMGDVALPGCHIPGLRLDRLTCDVLAVNGRACIDGKLSMVAMHAQRFDAGTSCVHNPHGLAVNGTTMTIERSADFDRAFCCSGRATFVGASIGGQLSLVESTWDNTAQAAEQRYGFSLYQATIARNLFLRNAAFLATGLNLEATHIASIQAEGLRIENPGGRAVSLRGATIDRGLKLTDCDIEGEVNVKGTKVGTSLVVESGHLRMGSPPEWSPFKPATTAIRIEALRTGEELYLGPPRSQNEATTEPTSAPEQLRIGGDVMIAGSSIGGGMDLAFTQLTGSVGSGDTTSRPSAAIRQCDVARTFTWRAAPAGPVAIHDVDTDCFDVDSARLPPASSALEGLQTRRLAYGNSDSGLQARITWLDAFTTPQPGLYSALADQLEAEGRDRQARDVRYARERQLARCSNRGRAHAVWSAALRFTVGYGYRPGRAWLWVVGLLLAGSLLGAYAMTQNLIVATSSSVSAANACESAKACFSPIEYGIDTVVPVIDLGQGKAWAITTANPEGWALEGGHLLLKLGGWVFTTAAIAGLGRAWTRR